MLSFIAAKVYQDRHRISMPVLSTLLGAGFCLLVWVCVVLPRPLHLWQRILAASSAPYGALLYYAAVKQMFSPTRSWSLTRSKAFWCTTLLIASIIVLDICLGEQSPVFDGTETYTPSWMFYTESALSYSTLLY